MRSRTNEPRITTIIPLTITLLDRIGKSFYSKSRTNFMFAGLMSKKGLSLIALFVILTAIPLTVFLSQQRQEIRQRAAERQGGPRGEGGTSGDGGVSIASLEGNATCQITATKQGGNSVKVDFSGTFSGQLDVRVSALVERLDGQEISGISPVIASWPPESFYPAFYYLIGRCDPLGSSCSSPVVVTLPPGNYLFSCAVQKNYTTSYTTSVCFGSNCKSQGGSLDCTPPASTKPRCSQNDTVVFNLAPTPTPQPPTASITGPSTGTVGQNLIYNTQFSNGGSATVFVSRQDNNTFTCPPGIFTDSTGRKWCTIGTLTSNSSTVFTPRETGTYAVLVNAYANSTATFTADRATECTGNPFGLNPTQQAQWSDCGPNDNLTVNISAGVTPTPTPAPLTADVDRNGCVGIVDFNLWLRAYQSGTAQPGTSPDINGDGKIDLLDFNVWYKAMRSLPSDKLCR